MFYVIYGHKMMLFFICASLERNIRFIRPIVVSITLDILKKNTILCNVSLSTSLYQSNAIFIFYKLEVIIETII